MVRNLVCLASSSDVPASIAEISAWRSVTSFFQMSYGSSDASDAVVLLVDVELSMMQSEQDEVFRVVLKEAIRFLIG